MNTGEYLVHAAQEYADKHLDGEGYWLEVRLSDGTVIRGPHGAPHNGVMLINPYTDNSGVDYGHPIWVRLDQVISVQIVD